MFNSGARDRSSSREGRKQVGNSVCIYDCRSGKELTETWLDISGWDFNYFLGIMRQEFAIPKREAFVLTTTDRTVLDFDRFKEIQSGSTLYLLRKEDEALSASTKELITFTPHYNTLVQCGSCEYNASEGQLPMAYVIGELIDNALTATAKNAGLRTIEIRLLFDETLGKPALVVLDNGNGMTSKKLNYWAVYRLSKFASKAEGYVQPDPVPRSLNSDISHFGVGGKQAVFYLGDSARMITKPAGSPDVHELVLSKQEFERKDKDGENVYSGVIRNRRPGDSSHVNKTDERFLHDIIAEEIEKDSFTTVVVTGILPKYIAFLREDFTVWTRQLAHMYHYYIHGVHGNDMERRYTNVDDLPQVDIQIILREKPPRSTLVLNLREVDDDMQTLYINAAADTFEFKATTEQDASVEGVIRYHPFLYDRETYPQNPNATQAPSDDDNDDTEPGGQHQARRKKPIFECFWNGRLIPYTTVPNFPWCAWSKDSKVPEECYGRLSGAIFTDYKFEVSTNKLTFMELELKLKKSIFTRVVNGQKQRINIQKEFTQWLQGCHEKLDKKIKFLGYKETITRTDVPTKKMQHPWGVFSAIEWDGKVYRAGQLVKTHRTLPILYGTVVQFLLFGNYSEEVFATGGQVQLVLEPKAFYDKIKTIPISKIDQTVTVQAIKKHIQNDFFKLPDKLRVEWPDDNPWQQNAVYPAGTPLGPLRVEILNKKSESISRMPTVGHGPVNKLSVELKVMPQGDKNDPEVFSLLAHHSTSWGYWFKKIEDLCNLGKYTLLLSAVMSDSNATTFGGRALPSYKLNFTIEEGSAESFVLHDVNPTPQVGVPFNIPLLMKDAYNHRATPPPNVIPELKCSGLDLSYESVDASEPMFTIRNVKANGKVLQNESKPYELKVTLPGLKNDTQTINIRLLPGKPHSLHVTPADNPITVENGLPVRFDVEVHDEAGNITANSRQIVDCQIPGRPDSKIDCSSTGAGQLVTKPINVKIIKGKPQKVKVQFKMPSQKSVAVVARELLVVPSKQVSSMELYSQDGSNLVLKNEEKIEWLAGGLLENLYYRLYDESAIEVPLTPEIASKIKVNWSPDVDLKDLLRGKLPDLEVPTQVQDKRFYQVSYQAQSLSVNFYISPIPDEPFLLKATLPPSNLKLGEPLHGHINLQLVDQYGNDTQTLTSACVTHMSVEAEGLDTSAVAFLWEESSKSVRVTGIQFNSGAPGNKEMCFKYGNYMAQVFIEVMVGAPAHLKLLSEPEKPLQVLNGSCISTPFVLQLCDKWGNPSPDRRVVVYIKPSSPALKVKTRVSSQPVTAEGKASFTVSDVSGPKGCYQLEFGRLCNNTRIPGPSVSLVVLPDPNKPVSLSVEYNTGKKLPAGAKFPVFSVTVVSEEGSPITTFNPAAITMYVLQEAQGKNMLPPITELKCSKPVENEKNECFHFRDKEIPEHAGLYTIHFTLHIDKRRDLSSREIPVNVVANEPVKLAPDSKPPIPVVSYSQAIANRTLVENLTLWIMDSYGNPAGPTLQGNVKVSIKNTSEDDNKCLPLFEGETSSCQFRLEDGKVHIARLAVMENSPGEDGSSYILIFTPDVPVVATPLEAFQLPFHFYNDVVNQQKMSELTKKKNELTTTIDAYKDNLNTRDQLLQLLTTQRRDAHQKETELRKALQMKKVTIPSSVSMPFIENLIQEKTTETDRILKSPRRVFSIRDPFKGQPEVLGMVGHLAFVVDDDAARVISWQIRGDMDCVITRTSSAAERIWKATQGKQQVMPLDCVHVRQSRPLPHIRAGAPLFNPTGNPVYARRLLLFPQDSESCHNVFKNLLGDVILMDDLHSANVYRKSVVQYRIPCPTILTREGDRVSATGKFGGAQNKAPPINMLHVFGAPYPDLYNDLLEQKEMLAHYSSTLHKILNVEKERDALLQGASSPEMQTKQQEMKEKEAQLVEIEKQIESTRARTLKRHHPDDGEPSGITQKRVK